MTIKIRCPDCGRNRNFLPTTQNKDVWSAQCFFCGKRFKVCPKNKPARVV